MRFSHFLSSYYPNTTYGGKQLFDDMLEQARLAERLGFSGVSIPEHHFMDILLNPAPLQMAVKVASITERIEVTTAVVVLPFHDIKRLAGEIVVAEILCDGRLVLGVGRGAFGFEFERFGVPAAESRAKFDEALLVLGKLMSEEDVSWSGRYYRFEQLTIMPRPMNGSMPPMMIAALAPEAIYHCAKRGFHVQTTPLMGSLDQLRDQVQAFHNGCNERGTSGGKQRISVLRVGFAASNDQDAGRVKELAHGYYKRFDNVFTGPNEIVGGAITPLPREQTVAELAENLLVGTPDELVEKLAPYAEAGIDEVNLNMNIGAGQAETLEAMQRFAEEVMPHFS